MIFTTQCIFLPVLKPTKINYLGVAKRRRFRGEEKEKEEKGEDGRGGRVMQARGNIHPVHLYIVTSHTRFCNHPREIEKIFSLLYYNL